MATANFRNHENGIYVLDMATEEQAREMLLHEYDDEEITEDMVTSAIYNDYEWLVEGLATFSWYSLKGEYSADKK